MNIPSKKLANYLEEIGRQFIEFYITMPRLLKEVPLDTMESIAIVCI